MKIYAENPNSLTIIDSYELNRKKRMKEYLRCANLMYPKHIIWNRSINSLAREWKAHNRLYNLNLYRSHTKDVDFEYPQKWYLSVIYFILGI